MRVWSINRSNLGFQLFALYMLLIIPLLITLFIFDIYVGNKIQKDVQTSDKSLALSIAQESDVFITGALQMVSGLATNEDVIRLDNDKMLETFGVVYSTQPKVNLIYRLDDKGQMIFHYPTGPGSTVGDDFSFRDYYQKALTTTQPFVSKGRISPTTNQPVATAVMPLWSSEGKFLGLVGANVKLESLSNILVTIADQHQAQEGFEVMIIDSDGQIIGHPDSQLLLHSADEVLPTNFFTIADEQNNSLALTDPNGIERLYTNIEVESAGWMIVISQPVSIAYGTQITLRQIVTVAVILILSIGLIFWFTLHMRVLMPLERLVNVSRAIGDNLPITSDDRESLVERTSNPDQIGKLIHSIFQMETSISNRLKEQQTLLETSTAVISDIKLESVLEKILEQIGTLMDIQMCAVIGKDESSGAFKIWASRGLSKQFSERLSIMPNEPDSVTMRAMNAGVPIQVSDTETDPTYAIRKYRARAEGYRALLAVPLKTKHAPSAALLLFHKEPHYFSDTAIQLLVNFANHAVMAIENAILFERSDTRLQEQTNRLESLIQSLQDGLILTDPANRVVYANRTVLEISGFHADEIVDIGLSDLLLAVFARAEEQRYLEQQLHHWILRDPAPELDLSILTPAEKVYYRLGTFSVRDSKGDKVGKGILFHNTTADKELDRIRASLLSAVSHEIRTPLASIKGFATTLLAEDVVWDRSSQKEFLTVISQQADQLSYLVNNILDFSKIDAGTLNLEIQKCDLPGLISSAWGWVDQLQNELVVHLPQTMSVIYADPIHLRTIIRNLLENAVKYGEPGDTIEVTVSEDDHCYDFTIQDNGPGIPQDQRSKVFESFYRVDDSLTRKQSGVGLGLAICQGLVRAHGGKIWIADSTKGTCMKFTIPKQIISPDYGDQE